MVGAVKLELQNVEIRPPESRRTTSQIDRFREPYRSFIRALLAGGSPALEDLLFSFPALAFALASNHGSIAARRRAIRLIEEGAPLREAAATLGIAWWLRRLPPEAFAGPLGPLPDSIEFSRRIANHIPSEVERAESWFQRVVIGNDLAGETFAHWIAWRTKAMPRLRDMDRTVLMAAWAWFSGQPGTAGHRLIRRPFDPSMGYRRAIDEAEHWKKRVELAIALGEGISDTWYPAGRQDGYDFVPLASLEAFLAEAHAMDNCLDQYGVQVAMRTTRVFSIRKDGRSYADLEIGPHEDDSTMPVIEQLRGPANRRVPAEIWKIAYAWLAAQQPRPLLAARSAGTAEGRAVARRIWSPLLRAVAGKPSEARLKAFLKGSEIGENVPR